jgi:hypothetical protein
MASNQVATISAALTASFRSSQLRRAGKCRKTPSLPEYRCCCCTTTVGAAGRRGKSPKHGDSQAVVTRSTGSKTQMFREFSPNKRCLLLYWVSRIGTYMKRQHLLLQQSLLLEQRL